MDPKIDEYIQGLPEDLQEKARSCKSIDELLALAKEKKVPIPEEALEAIAGGTGQEVGDCFDRKKKIKVTCPQCSDSTNVAWDSRNDKGEYHFHCWHCDYQWWQKI